MHSISSSLENVNFWENLSRVSEASKNAVEASANLSASSLNTTAEVTQWCYMERMGIAKIAGMAMVPSQYDGRNLEDCNQIVESAIRNVPNQCVKSIGRIEITSETGVTVKGIMIYPLKYDPQGTRCIVYNNPNACTIPEFLNGGYGLNPHSPPYQLLELRQTCPLLMYDYRGTGISQKKYSESSLSSFETFVEKPSYRTLSEDGSTVLEYAMNRFNTVEVWGSSLGGGVATIACETYLAK